MFVLQDDPKMEESYDMGSQGQRSPIMTSVSHDLTQIPYDAQTDIDKVGIVGTNFALVLSHHLGVPLKFEHFILICNKQIVYLTSILDTLLYDLCNNILLFTNHYFSDCVTLLN